jgi:hypothetical protein
MNKILEIFMIFLMSVSFACTNSSDEIGYYVPTEDELFTAEQLFEDTLNDDKNFDNLKQSWRQLNFSLSKEVDPNGDAYWKLTPFQPKQGGGSYWFLSGNSASIALQAPHSLDEIYTDSIATKLFYETDVAAVAFSTISRQEADVADLQESYFQAFTKAFITVYPQAIIMQIHGFRQENRETEMGRKSDIIISNGSENPADWVKDYHACVKSDVDGLITLFPYDVEELGGTLNAQGNLIRSLGSHGFLHVEHNYSIREKMKDDKNLRKVLVECLSEKVF